MSKRKSVLQKIGFLLYAYDDSECSGDSVYREDYTMASYKYKHPTLDDRIDIQKGLKAELSFADIASSVGKDPSTISKEIREHLIMKETGTRSRPFNPCMGRKICTAQRKACAQCDQTYNWHNRC